MLYLIFKLRQLLNDGLSLLALLLIRHIGDSPMQVINGSSLGRLYYQMLHVYSARNVLTTITGHRSLTDL
jgi:hypothetical protein